jgi:hypothetical protein
METGCCVNFAAFNNRKMKKIITTVFAICASASLFGQTVPTNGLVGRYSFDENFNDASGNNRHLIYVSKISSDQSFRLSDTSKIGKSLAAFDKDIFSALYHPSNDFNFANTFSASVWAQPTSNMLQNGFIFVNRANISNGNGGVSIYNNYALWISNIDRKIHFTCNDVIVSSTTLTQNYNWYHIAVSYNNGVGKIYVNGILESTNTSFPATINTYGNGTYFNKDYLMVGGLFENGQSQYNSFMDELYLYNRELSQQEVANIHNGNSSSIENIKTSKINVFPNPTQNKLNIKSDVKIKEVITINSMGQMSEFDIINNSIDISTLPIGIYTIQIKDENGNLFTNKFIKE